MSSLVLGFGCERDIEDIAVIAGIKDFLESREYAIADLETIASFELKDDEDGLRAAARFYGVSLEFFDAESLKSVPGIPNPSEVVEESVGVPGVAEPAALLASETDTLIVEKTVLRPKNRAMTLALAQKAKVVNKNE